MAVTDDGNVAVVSVQTKGSLPDGLKDDLNAAIQRVGGSDGAFVRLTTRRYHLKVASRPTTQL